MLDLFKTFWNFSELESSASRLVEFIRDSRAAWGWISLALSLSLSEGGKLLTSAALLGA